ncbi:hypothetical protein [Bacillus pacificus]|uniref:hypothetical protein n=1 Tax=Bacillus pacificus TaxID=2026187 RepID=UPI003D64E0BD
MKRNGKSARAETQVRRWNRQYENVYDSRVVKRNIRGRSNALSWEVRHSDYRRSQGHSMRLHSDLKI